MKGDTPDRLGDYEVQKSWEGFASIRQISSGEIMHSRTDPMEEARQLYVEQSHLAERLSEKLPEPLVLWTSGSAPPRMRSRRSNVTRQPAGRDRSR
jgi:hypothetical protein